MPPHQKNNNSEIFLKKIKKLRKTFFIKGWDYVTGPRCFGETPWNNEKHMNHLTSPIPLEHDHVCLWFCQSYSPLSSNLVNYIKYKHKYYTDYKMNILNLSHMITCARASGESLSCWWHKSGKECSCGFVLWRNVLCVLQDMSKGQFPAWEPVAAVCRPSDRAWHRRQHKSQFVKSSTEFEFKPVDRPQSKFYHQWIYQNRNERHPVAEGWGALLFCLLLSVHTLSVRPPCVNCGFTFHCVIQWPRPKNSTVTINNNKNYFWNVSDFKDIFEFFYKGPQVDLILLFCHIR